MPARCPLCLRCHGPAPGDSGGAMYSDAALAAADKERKMIGKLCKHGLIRAGTLEAQLQSVGTCRRAEPRDLQAYADAVRATLPQGILLVHEDLRACFLFRASQPPRLFNFACALALIHSGTAACFALLRRDRMRRVTVRRKH